MSSSSIFQGVACHSFEADRSIEDILKTLINPGKTSVHHNVECYDLELKNKYYEATVHIFECNLLSANPQINQILEESHAIILYANGLTITTEKLDEKIKTLDHIAGEPRILICEGIEDEDCGPRKTIQDWCIVNGYDLLDYGSEDLASQLIDSLSAYKWQHRSNKIDTTDPQLDDDTIRKLIDFDYLLDRMRSYRERSENRDEVSGDKNIVEIAQLLSGLLGDDIDSFLQDDDNA